MAHKIMEINPDLVPFEFNISLLNEIFLIGVNYNETGQFFTIGLSKMDTDTGQYIEVCAGEPIVYCVPLWNDVKTGNNFPKVEILPYDDSGETNKVTFDNLNRNVFLKVYTDDK